MIKWGKVRTRQRDSQDRCGDKLLKPRAANNLVYINPSHIISLTLKALTPVHSVAGSLWFVCCITSPAPPSGAQQGAASYFRERSCNSCAATRVIPSDQPGHRGMCTDWLPCPTVCLVSSSRCLVFLGVVTHSTSAAFALRQHPLKEFQERHGNSRGIMTVRFIQKAGYTFR